MNYSQCIANFNLALQNKKLRDALKFIREAVIADPKQIEGWKKLAMLYLVDMGKSDDAVRVLKRALKLHPQNPILFDRS